MGRINNLNSLDKELLCEVARMSYGTSQGIKGGTGHIGLVDEKGQLRIVKFDTHGGKSTGIKAQNSSNGLRVKLLNIAENAGLSKSEIEKIKSILLLDKTNESKPKPLLERKITARVVEMIGGYSVWKYADAGHDKTYASSKSKSVKTFDDVMEHAGNSDTANVRRVKVGDGVKEDGIEKAKKEIEMFRAFATKNKGYVRFNKKGTALEDAGTYTFLRTTKAKMDNNEVHQRLSDSIKTYYGGKMPKAVEDAMSGFAYDGEPLLTKEILEILEVVDKNAPKKAPVKSQEANGKKGPLPANDKNRVQTGQASVKKQGVGSPKQKKDEFSLTNVLKNLQETLGLKDGIPNRTIEILDKALKGVTVPSQAAVMIIALAVEDELGDVEKEKMLFLASCCRQFLDCKNEGEPSAEDGDFFAILIANVDVLMEKIGDKTLTKDKIASVLMDGQKVKGGYNKLTNAQFVKQYDKYMTSHGRPPVDEQVEDDGIPMPPEDIEEISFSDKVAPKNSGKVNSHGGGQDDVLSEIRDAQKNLKKAKVPAGKIPEKSNTPQSPLASMLSLRRKKSGRDADDGDDGITISVDRAAKIKTEYENAQKAKAAKAQARKRQYIEENKQMREEVKDLNLPKLRKVKGGTLLDQLKRVKLVKTQKAETKNVVEEKGFFENALSLQIKNRKAQLRIAKGDDDDDDDQW